MYTIEETKKMLKYYVRIGIVVIPLHGIIWDEESKTGTCTCGKADCTKPGKHPMMAWKHLAQEPLSVDKLMSIIDNAQHMPNWGAMTGPESGMYAFDVDKKSSGLDTIAAMGLTIPDGFPRTPISNTGGGGHHILFRYPEDTVVANRVNLAPGIDVRGYHGFIVIPPSRYVTGTYYIWQVPPWEAAFADVDYNSTIDAFEKYAKSVAVADKKKPVNTYQMVMTGVVEGERNSQMTRLAGRYLGLGLSDEEARVILRHLNATKFEPPLPDLDLHTIISSIRRSEGAATPEADPEDMKAAIVNWLGLNKTISDDKEEIHLVEVFKITGTDPKYKFAFKHGEDVVEVKMPSGSLHSSATFTRVIADNLMRVPRQLGTKTMPTHAMLLNYILALAVTVNSGEEGTEEGETMVFIRSYLTTETVTPLLPESKCPPRGSFKTADHYWINLQEFNRWLMLQSSSRMTMQMLAQTLASFHCTKKAFYTEAGTSRTMWGISQSLVAERGV